MLFVGNSDDLKNVQANAGKIISKLSGPTRSSFWHLYPCEWDDFEEETFACYVERRALFSAMRACEAYGLQSAFPHPADLWELITSKTWMATLCAWPAARMPPATLVSRGSVVRSSQQAAADAVKALAHLRSINPSESEPPTASGQKEVGGVVKLGWSWENRFVLGFWGEEHLRARPWRSCSSKRASSPASALSRTGSILTLRAACISCRLEDGLPTSLSNLPRSSITSGVRGTRARVLAWAAPVSITLTSRDASRSGDRTWRHSSLLRSRLSRHPRCYSGGSCQ